MNTREVIDKLITDLELLDNSCVGDIIELEDGYKDYLPYKSDKFKSGRISLFEAFTVWIRNDTLREAVKLADESFFYCQCAVHIENLIVRDKE